MDQKVNILNATVSPVISGQFNIKLDCSIEDLPPVANFTATPISGFGQVSVNFIDNSSNHPTTWSWDFGDGNTSNLQNPNHGYQTVGIFSVTLTVNGGSTATAIITVNPVASFSTNPSTLVGNEPFTVSFTDNTIGATNWNWSFGDNTNSALQNPTHVYSTGNYTTTLTVNGGSSTSKNVSVQAPLPPPSPVPGFTPSPSTIIIYVSQSGSDTNDGLSPNKAKKTIAAGVSVLRDGQPDWLLLKNGDTFDEPVRWKKSGKSATEPMLFGTYGTGNRPVIRTGSAAGFQIRPGSGTPAEVNYLVVTGLHLYAHTRDPAASTFTGTSGSNGIDVVHQCKDLQFDNLKIQSYLNNVVAQGWNSTGTAWLDRIKFTRCIILDSYSPNETTHSQGIYCERVRTGLVIKNCILDHNGYGEQTTTTDDPTAYNHNLYLQWNNGLDVIVQDNILCRAASHALQLRSGGTIKGNFCFRNPINLQPGYDGQPNLGTTPVPNATFSVSDNVVLEGINNETPIPTDRGSGWGINFSTLVSATCSNNVVAHCKTTSPNRRSIEVKPNIQYSGNIIWDWTVGKTGIGWGETLETPGPFKDPERTVGTYCASLGLPGTTTEFLARIRAEDPRFTASALNSYFKDGFVAS